MKKWPLEYQKVIKTYLTTYLWDSSDISDSCDSFDSCDSSDSSDNSDISDSSDSSDRSDISVSSDNSEQTTFFTRKLFFTQKNKKKIKKNDKETFIALKDVKTQMVMKLKNSNCDESQKLKLW